MTYESPTTSRLLDPLERRVPQPQAERALHDGLARGDGARRVIAAELTLARESPAMIQLELGPAEDASWAAAETLIERGVRGARRRTLSVAAAAVASERLSITKGTVATGM